MITPGGASIGRTVAVCGLLLGLAVDCTALRAQDEGGTGALGGVVRAADSGAGVEDAQVFLPLAGRSTLTNVDGRFTLRGLPAGPHRVEISRIGLERWVADVMIVPDSTTEVVAEMAVAPIELDGIEVEARSGSFLPGFLRRREAHQGYFFTKADIDVVAPERLTQAIDRLLGVDVRYDPETGWDVRVWNQERMSRMEPAYCVPNVLLDGRLRPEWTDLNEIRPGDVLAMEVYWKASEVPESLERIGLTQPLNRHCGVIAVWTELRPTG